MLRSTSRFLPIFLAFALLLSGCGGGGGGGDGGGGDNFTDTTAVGSSGTDTNFAVGTALLSWTPPTANTDESTLTNLAGYRIYYGTESGSYDETITLDSTELTSYLIENLPAATWYFTMTAYNSDNLESAYSEEVSKVVN